MKAHTRQLNVISRYGPIGKQVKPCGMDEYGNRWAVMECGEGYALCIKSSRSKMIVAFRYGETIQDAEGLKLSAVRQRQAQW